MVRPSDGFFSWDDPPPPHGKGCSVMKDQGVVAPLPKGSGWFYRRRKGWFHQLSVFSLGEGVTHIQTFQLPVSNTTVVRSAKPSFALQTS